MNVKYIEFKDKHPKDKKEDRVYSDAPNPNWRSYGCSYSGNFLKLDIDDYDHATEQLEEPIKGKARSEAVIELLNALNVRYNGIRTEHGIHLFFRVPSGLETKTKQNWYSVIGVRCEWKFPQSDDHIPLKIKGVERQFFKGSIDNTEIDELPYFLYPLQKGKEKPFNISFPRGERTQVLGAYLFHLVSTKGFEPEQAFNIVRYMNRYVFEEPIEERTLEAQITNESTLEKLQNAQQEKESKNLKHEEIGDEIIARFTLIRVNGDFYCYENGLYRPFSDDRFKKYMSDTYPKAKINFKREVLDYLKGKAYRDEPKECNIINVKNGILTIDGDSVRFVPHDPAYITFKQFNAAYCPEAESPLLQDALQKWFDGDADYIDLFAQLLGYLMMNHVDYEKIFFFQGRPSTGKTSVMKLITDFCGRENVSSVSLSALNEKYGMEPPINKTANIFSDIPKVKVLQTDRFKMLADGSPQEIRRMYKPSLNYSFTGKCIFGMNHFPDMSKDFEGIKRRIILFRFDHEFRKGDLDYNPHINSDLETEATLSALLNMAIQGYKSLVSNKGFTIPQKSEAALEEFEAANNTVLRWILENEITEEYLLREAISYQGAGSFPAYKSFCFSVGIEPLKDQKDFTREITKRYGFKSDRRSIPGIGRNNTDNRARFFIRS